MRLAQVTILRPRRSIRPLAYPHDANSRRPATPSRNQRISPDWYYWRSNTTLYFSVGALVGVPSIVRVLPSTDTE